MITKIIRIINFHHDELNKRTKIYINKTAIYRTQKGEILLKHTTMRTMHHLLKLYAITSLSLFFCDHVAPGLIPN